METQDAHRNEKLPSTVSLIIPTELRAAFAFSMKSRIVSGFSDEQPGGSTGRAS